MLRKMNKGYVSSWVGGGATLPESSATISIATPKKAKAKSKLVSSAKKPIKTGPIKMPEYPKVVTAEIAVEVGMAFCLPVAAKINGITLAFPKPIIKNPSSENAFGKTKRVSTKPQKEVMHPITIMRRSPPTRLISHAPIRRPKARAAEKTAKPIPPYELSKPL